MGLPINEIIEGDSLEVLRSFPDKCIDLVLCDPPYGINAHEGVGKYGRLKQAGNKDLWDSCTPDSAIFDEIFRVSKNQIIFGGNYFNLPQSRCWIVWDKGEGFYNRDFAEVELIWTSLDKNSKIIKYDPLAGRDYINKQHPTQKPIPIMRKILDILPETKTILDPFAGSGSTLIAAKEIGIDYIGIEISPKYCEIARERIKSVTQKLL